MSEARGKYSSLIEQEKLISSLYTLRSKVPRRYWFLSAYGDRFSCIPVLAIGFVTWRAAFRGFNLAKYGKARTVTMIPALASTVNGPVCHHLFVTSPLHSCYRDESWTTYAFRSWAALQVGFITATFASIYLTFVAAKRFGFVYIPGDPHYLGTVNKLNYIVSKLKPYSKNLALTWAVSSVFCLGLGILEYKQSKYMLTLLGRDSLSENKATET